MSIVNISNPERKTFRLRSITEEGAKSLKKIIYQNKKFYAEGDEWEEAKFRIRDILAEGKEVLDKDENYIDLEDRRFDNTLEYIEYLAENVFTQLVPDQRNQSRDYTDTRQWNDKCKGIWTWLTFAYLESYLKRGHENGVPGVKFTEHEQLVFAPDAGLHWETKTYRHILRSNMIHFIKYPTIKLPFVTSRPGNTRFRRVLFTDMAEQLFSRTEICTNKNYMEILDALYIEKDGNLIEHGGDKKKGRYGTLRRAVTTTKGNVIPTIQRKYMLGLMSREEIKTVFKNIRDFKTDNFLKETRK